MEQNTFRISREAKLWDLTALYYTVRIYVRLEKAREDINRLAVITRVIFIPLRIF